MQTLTVSFWGGFRMLWNIDDANSKWHFYGWLVHKKTNTQKLSCLFRPLI